MFNYHWGTVSYLNLGSLQRKQSNSEQGILLFFPKGLANMTSIETQVSRIHISHMEINSFSDD